MSNSDKNGQKTAANNNEQFNAASSTKPPQRKKAPAGGKDVPVQLSPAQMSELLAALANALPAYAADSFDLHGEKITPSAKQREIVDEIETRDILFINGPVGSGKTFWPSFAALHGLANGRFSMISLAAPAVESDEKLGFLPGNADEKMEKYVLQLIETIKDIVGAPLYERLKEASLINTAAHAYNRGLTHKRKIYLLDESQNASGGQLMTSIGRIGFGATFVYMGDACDSGQNDRTASKPAYSAFIERFTDAAYGDRIGYVKLEASDVKRHPLIQLMVERGDNRPLEGFEDAHDSRVSKGERPYLGRNKPNPAPQAAVSAVAPVSGPN